MKWFRPLRGVRLYVNSTDDSHQSASETLFDCLLAAKNVVLFRSSAREITLCLLPSTRNCLGVEEMPRCRGTAMVSRSCLDVEKLPRCRGACIGPLVACHRSSPYDVPWTRL